MGSGCCGNQGLGIVTRIIKDKKIFKMCFKAGIAKSKKAVFFTIAAIILSMAIILSIDVYTGYRLKEKMDVIETRVNTMNNFIKDVEQDLKNGVYISSFRAFLSVGQYIASNGTIIGDVEETFNELFIDGTINGQEASLMVDSTITDWAERIRAEADEIDIIANFTIEDTTLSQEDPWYLTVSININMEIRDKKETSSWSINKEVRTNVSILGLEDPLYVKNSYGRVSNTIRHSPFGYFVTGNNVDNLLEQINESYYIATNMSPSYLMRLEGNLANSTMGIESFVNLQEFIDQSLTTKDRSAVDYIYFGNQTTTNHRINQTPSWFKLDSGHLTTYGVQDLVI